MATASPLINFIKKTYLIFIIVLAAVLFFLGYNAYLVDRSLANLRIALDKVNDVKTLEDAHKLSSLLDYSLLNEVSSESLDSATIAKIEYAKDILDNPKEDSQLKDAQFAIGEVVAKKEKQRTPLLRAIDKLAGGVVPAITTAVAKDRLEAQVVSLKERLPKLRDTAQLQEAYYELGNLYTQLSEFPKAQEAFRKVGELDPNSVLAQKAWFNLAWSQKREGSYEEALKSFEALATATGDKEIEVFSKYQMAETYKKKGDYEKAIEAYRSIENEQVSPELSQVASLQIPSVYLYDLGDLEKAQEEAVRIKTRFASLEVAKHLEANTESAIIAQYRRKGFLLLKEGYETSDPEKLKEALPFFDKALDIDAGDGQSYTGKGMAYLWLEDPDRALVFARKAVELLPEDEVASINLFYIYIDLNIVDEALIEAKRFTSANAKSASGFFNLGYAYAIRGEYEQAVTAFRRASLEDPKLAIAFNNDGWCLWQLGKYAEALESFRKAIAVSPDYVEAIFNLGLIYRILGRYDEAKQQFEAVLKLNPTDYPQAKALLEATRNLLEKR